MLLTNWLKTLTSRIKKRPVYRSRDRRAIRRRWQAIINNQIATTEALEDRTLLTIFTVENLDASGTGSLADAIDQANASAGLDTIVFQTGLTGTINAGTTLHIEDDVVINGDTDGDPNTKEIMVTGNDLFRVFTVISANATFSNFAITAGEGNTGYSDLGGGGGILASGNLPNHTLTLQAMEFSGNEASWGAAVHAFNTIVSIEDSLFFDNIAAADGVSGDFVAQGGAINITESRNEGVSHTITDSTFINNQTTESTGLYGGGGAIAYASFGGQLNIQESVFDSNQTAGPQGGGAILAKIFEAGTGMPLGISANVRVYDSLLVNNAVTDQANANADGGAISSIGSNGMSMRTTIVNSTLMNNTVQSASGGGGAVSSTVLNGTVSNMLNVSESTFSGNFAPSGGAIATNATYLNLFTSTFTGNTANAGETGGIYLKTNVAQPTNDLKISGSILDGNSGNQIGTDGGLSNLTTSNGYNLINGTVENIPNGFIFQTSDLTGVSANLSALIANGSLVGAPGAQSVIQTHVPLSGSPAIDNGGTPAPFDQIGTSRPQGAAPDIGSIETTIPTVVYVDDSFSNPVIGEDPDGVGAASIFGYDAFATLQDAIDHVADGGTIQIAEGTYPENVNATAAVTDKQVSLAFGNLFSQVTLNGDLSLDSGDQLEINIADTFLHDQVVVNGAVSINDAFLKLIDNGSPNPGDQLLLIQNDGSDPINGTFFLDGTLTRLTEGYEFTDFLGVTGQSAYLTYQGGDGNDLAIVVEDSTPELSLPANGTADQYTLRLVGENVVVSDDNTGEVLYNAPLSVLGSPLLIYGEDGQDDTLTIDLTGIDENSPLQIDFSGGLGGNDALNLTGGDLVTMAYYFNSVSTGRIHLNASMRVFLGYSDLERITTSVASENVVLNYSDTSETITITNAGGGMTTIDSTAGEFLTFVDPTDVLLLNAGGGDDTINIDSLAANYSGELRIVGGDDDDILNVNTSLSLSADKYLLLTAEDINLNGGSITTNGYVWQSYHGDVTLGADTVINNIGGEGIYFDFTVNGMHSLDVMSDGFIAFYDSVTVDALTANAGTVIAQLNGSINTGANDVELTAGEDIAITNITTTGEVRLTAVTGAIVDYSTDESSNINADRVVLRAGTEIGGSSDNTLETTVNTLAASVANGKIEIVNTGALEIGTVDSLDGITATNGDVNITATSPLTVNQAISGASVTLTASDSAGTDDNLVINADITSALSYIALYSGDNFTLSALASLTANTLMVIEVDPSAGDPDTEGSTVDLLGEISATETLIQGGDDADTFNINPSMNSPLIVIGGNPTGAPGDILNYFNPVEQTANITPSGSDGGTINITGGFDDVTFYEIETFATDQFINGTNNDDTLIITVTDANSGTYQLNGGPVISFSNLDNITFNGWDGNDTFIINSPTGELLDPVDNITFHGGSGNNRLELSGGVTTTVEHLFVSEGKGSIFFDSEATATISYTGMGAASEINDLTTANHRIFTFTTQSETINVTDTGSVNTSTIDSTRGTNVFFDNPSNSLTINSDIGADTVEFSETSDIGYTDLIINGGTLYLNGDHFLRNVDLNVSQVTTYQTLEVGHTVNIQATGSVILLGGINARNGNINLTGSSVAFNRLETPGIVSVTATTTEIDLFGDGINIIADQVALRSVSGSDLIKTQVNSLAAQYDNGNINIINTVNHIINTDILTIGTVDGLSGLSANNGLINVLTAGSLQIDQLVSAFDSVELATDENSEAGDTLTVNAAVTSTASHIDLSAGDVLTIMNGGTVTAATEINLFVDAGSAGLSDAAGGIANVNGTLEAGTKIELTGGDHDDQVIIDGNGGLINDGGTVHAIKSNFLFSGVGGSDTLTIDDSGDTRGDLITITNTGEAAGEVSGAALAIFKFTDLDVLNFFAGKKAEEIIVLPNTVTTYHIEGGDPSMAPGDLLNYLVPTGETETVNFSSSDSGTISTTGGYADVSFSGIEALTHGSGNSLIIDGTNGNNTLIVTLTDSRSGSYQLDGALPVFFSDLTEFVFNGLDGNDTLIIQNPTKTVFDPVSGITFNGGAGDDELEILDGTANSVEYEFLNEQDGNIYFNGESIATLIFTGLEPITDTISASNRIFTYTGSDETIVLYSGSSDVSSRINSTLGELVRFNNPKATLTINANDPSDQIKIHGLSTGFTGDLKINGGIVELAPVNDLDLASVDLFLNVAEVKLSNNLTTTGQVIFHAANMLDLENGTIIADQVALSSDTGSITAKTQTSKLAASAEMGDLNIENTGSLNIDTVGSVSGLTATNGLITITSNGALTVNDSVFAYGTVDFTIKDTSKTGDDLTVNSDITSFTDVVRLTAGDILTVSPDGTLSGFEVHLFIDTENIETETVRGGIANLNGLLRGVSSKITGGNNDDQVIIDSNGGTTSDGGTVDGLTHPIRFLGMGGSDTLTLDDSGDSTADNVTIFETEPPLDEEGMPLVNGLGTITGLGPDRFVEFLFDSTVEQVELTTGAADDLISVSPNTFAALSIFGSDPTDAPGDTLIYFTPVGKDSTLTADGIDGGTISIDDTMAGYKDVVFDEIETAINTENRAIDGTAGDDVLTITATSTNSGTYQLNDGDVVEFFNLSDLTFNGLEGDDRLVIHNPTDGLFDPFNQIIFNGGTGGETIGDTLEILGGAAGTVEHHFVNDSAGSIHYNSESNATIVYTGLEPIIDTIEAANRQFHYSDTTETITLTDLGGGQSSIDSTAGELVTFVNPASLLEINAGGGSDTINVDSLDGNQTKMFGLSIDAGDGNDIINIGSNTPVDPLAVSGLLSVDAGDGNDTINVISLAANLEANLNINGRSGASDVVNINSPVSLGASHSLDVSAETIQLNGGSVTTGSSQTYAGNIVLGTDTTLDSGNDLNLFGNVTGAHSLNLTGGGFITNLLGDMTIGALTVNTTGGIGTGLLNVIDTGSGDISITAEDFIRLPSLVTTGDVKITSTNGSLFDQNGAAVNITANSAVLRVQGTIQGEAHGEMELPGSVLETQVNLLAASSDTGNIRIQNTGALEIGSFDGLLGLTAANGVVSVESSGALTVTEDVTATSIDFNGTTINLDSDLVSSSISGNATNVNVLGSTGGAEIHDAIALSASGATIQIAAGTFTPSETITISNALTIQGAQSGVDPRPGTGSLRDETDDSTETIIDGTGTLSQIFLIDADNVTLDGLVITNGTGDLVRSSNPVDNITIQNNIIHHSTGDEGVQLVNASNSTIQYNYIFDTAGDGANFDTSANSSIRFNEMRNIRSGNGAIFVDDSEAITIEGNYLDLGHLNNNDGIKVNDFSGTFNTTTSYILNNTVIDSLQDGITVGRSNVVVSGNEVTGSSSNNGAIFVSETVDNVQITNNSIHDNLAAVSGTDTNFAIRIGKHPSDFPTNVIVRDNSIVNNQGLIFFTQNTQANLDALRNWWGTTDPSVIAAGIVGVMDGGGNTNGSIDFSTILASSTDTSAAPGFQPDTTNLIVHTQGAGPEMGSLIQNAIDNIPDGGMIQIEAGIYVGDITLNRGITLSGTPDIQGTLTVTDGASLSPGFSPGIIMSNGLNILGETFALNNINLGSFTHLDVGPGEDLRYVESVQGENILFWRGSTGELQRATYTWNGTNLVLGAITSPTGLTSGDHASIINMGGGVLEGYFHTGTGPSVTSQYHAISNDGGQTWINETLIPYPFPTPGIGSDSGTTGGGGIIEINGERRIYAQNNFGDIVLWTTDAGSNGPLTNAGALIDGSTGNFQNQSPSGDAIGLSTGQTLYLYVDGEGSESSLGAIGALIVDHSGLGITSQIDNFISVSDLALSSAGLTSLDEMTIGAVQIAGNNITGVLMIDGDSVSNGSNEDLFYAPITINMDLLAPGNLDIEINGTTPGTEHDQIDVTGTVTIGTGATLNLIDGLTGPGTPGDTILFINNDGSDAVVGEFAGLANGSNVAFNGETWRIFYDGGDGNDVVLVYLSASVPEVFVNDDFTGPNGTVIADADPNTLGAQLAVIGVNAFATIQEGVDVVSVGGTVHITDQTGDTGTYSENVTITKDITLRGTSNVDGDVTITPPTGDGITVSGLATSATIENITVTGATGAGIFLENLTGDVLLTNVTSTFNNQGVLARNVNNLTDIDGTYLSNDNSGIFVEDITNNVTLTRSLLEDNNADGGLFEGEGFTALADLNLDAIGGNLLVEGVIARDSDGAGMTADQLAAFYVDGVSGNVTFQDSTGVVQSVLIEDHSIDGIVLHRVAGEINLTNVTSINNGNFPIGSRRCRNCHL